MTRTEAQYTGGSTCPTCGKRCWGTRKEAKRMARRLGIRGVNAYRCGAWWHLGHLPPVVSRGVSTREDITPAVPRTRRTPGDAPR